VQKKYRRNYECPTEFAMDVLSGKWKTVILSFLKERPMRYSELRILVPNLSDKVLTDRLRDVVSSGLVVRRKSPTAAGADRYALSERGDSLRPILSRLYTWGAQQAEIFGVRVGQPMTRLEKNGRAQSSHHGSSNSAKRTRSGSSSAQ
jgi:DNA-binding HxlR family transcriptional regulator